MMFKRLFSGLCAGAALSLAALNVQASEALNWQGASSVVENTMQEMLEVTRTARANDQIENTALLEQQVDEVLNDVVDFDYIARYVMGKYFRRASAEQQAAFAEVFRTTLVKTYVKAIAGFKIDEHELVQPQSDSPEADKQIVQMKVRSADGQQYVLLYYMRHKNDRWELVNAKLDGINLRLNFRNQFADMMQRERRDIDAVISNWQAQMESSAEELVQKTEGEA